MVVIFSIANARAIDITDCTVIRLSGTYGAKGGGFRW